jgi:outer membrane protein assembly factor BamE (lipoprotein component of BamABCDE complex)
MKIVTLRKPMIIVSSILLLCLFCHSCCAFPTIPTTESHRGPIDDESLSFLQVGKTTKEDVLLRLGNPTYCLKDEESFDYCWEILYGGWWFGSPAGGKLEGPVSSKHCLSLEFDKQGILTKREVTGNTYLLHKYDYPPRPPNCRDENLQR